jgi:8-oxo-dGTP pyrophosphatase MutT (NUDIX family)
MAQMYKVFIDNKPIIFTDSKDLMVNAESYPAELLKEFKNDLPILLEKIQPGTEFIIYCDDAEEEFKRLFASYQLIEAAGGIVLYGEEILCIKRNGFWDLPKGKIEANEKIELAAIREIEEECGVIGLTIVDELCMSYHTYAYNSVDVLKKTYWYLLCIDTKQILTPQIEEGISEAKWIAVAEVDHYFKDTFRSIQEVWQKFKEKAREK